MELFHIYLEGGPGGRGDWWTATLDPSANTPTDRQIEISGDGYSASFRGRAALNCEKGWLVWLSAEDPSRNLSGDTAADKLPPKVTRNALKIYCHFM